MSDSKTLSPGSIVRPSVPSGHITAPQPYASRLRVLVLGALPICLIFLASPRPNLLDYLFPLYAVIASWFILKQSPERLSCVYCVAMDAHSRATAHRRFSWRPNDGRSHFVGALFRLLRALLPPSLRTP